MPRKKSEPKKPKIADVKEEKIPQKRGPKLKGPVTPADFDYLEGLLKIQATLEEIAGFYDCDVKTIQARIEEHYGMKFSQLFALKRDGGKISLRRAQWNKAIQGNVTMQIWLGKQYLGQRDRIEQVGMNQDELEGLSLEMLQKEVEVRENRLGKIRLKNRDVSDYEAQLLEKSKKRAKTDE